MILYIDFTNGAVGTSAAKYHGGGDFCRFITEGLICNNQKKDIKIICLLSKNYNFQNVEEEKLFSKVDVLRINSLIEVKYLEDDILFLPIIDCFQINIIKRIRKLNEKLTIYCVLHGLRLIDLSKYDRYDKYYYNGIKSNGIYLWARRSIAVILSKYYLRRYIPQYNRVYTVSNNSMQSIVKYSNPQYIKYFLRDITRYENDIEPDKVHDVGYALFINANRYEKNFIRTLVSFCMYHTNNVSDLKLKVTGINEEFLQKLKKVKKIDWNIIEKKVVFMDYVSSEELNRLYRECSFLIYTSKSEGFGLPPLEAMNYNKPTLASRLTSVPEVLGFAAYYVDPYDEEMIEEGIKYLDNKKHRDLIIKQLKCVKDSLINRGASDISLLLEELFD